jgi:hypothetical protein
MKNLTLCILLGACGVAAQEPNDLTSETRADGDAFADSKPMRDLVERTLVTGGAKPEEGKLVRVDDLKQVGGQLANLVKDHDHWDRTLYRVLKADDSVYGYVLSVKRSSRNIQLEGDAPARVHEDLYLATEPGVMVARGGAHYYGGKTPAVSWTRWTQEKK